MHGSAGELPDEPRVDRPEGQVARGLAEDPLELRRREVRVGDEPRPVADEIGGELLAPLGRAPVLPDDGAVGRLAARPIPDDRRLALVRDADRGEIGRRRARVFQRLARGRKHGLPELVRVLLDPPGPGIVLRHLAVAAALRPQGFVEDEARRARRPLVDPEEHGYRAGARRPAAPAWARTPGACTAGARAGCPPARRARASRPDGRPVAGQSLGEDVGADAAIALVRGHAEVVDPPVGRVDVDHRTRFRRLASPM